MKNQNIMTLELSRLEVLDVRTALLSVVQSFRAEIAEAERAGDIEAANRAKKNAQKWYTLREKIVEQFDKQDKESAV